MDFYYMCQVTMIPEDCKKQLQSLTFFSSGWRKTNQTKKVPDNRLQNSDASNVYNREEHSNINQEC